MFDPQSLLISWQLANPDVGVIPAVAWVDLQERIRDATKGETVTLTERIRSLELLLADCRGRKE